MKLHVLSGGKVRMRTSLYFPEAPREQTTDFPCSCYLIRHKQGTVLFDTGCHPLVETDAAARWGTLARAITPVHAPGDNVIGGLKGIGLTPDDVDVVVNSHLHMDHCGCNEFFKKATFVAHTAERATAEDPASEGKGYYRADWDHPMRRQTIDGAKDLFDDDAIVLIPLPGHTPGSIGAKVELSRTGCVVIASDAAAVRANMTSEFSPKNSWNADAFRRSLAELQRFDAQRALLLFGHDADQWTTLKKGADAYE